MKQSKTWTPLPPACLITGGDSYLREQAIALLKGAGPGVTTQVLRLNTSEASPRAMTDELITLPMFASRKVVVVIDDDEKFQDFRDEIKEFLTHPTASSHLIWVAELVKGWESWKQKHDTVAWIDCRPLEEHEAVDWLIALAGKHSKKLDRPAADQLLQRCDGDLSPAASHVEKLCVYAGKRPALTSEDIAALVPDERGTENFALVRALQGGSAAEAMAVVTRMMNQGEKAQMIVGQLAWHYRQMLQSSRFRSDVVAKHHRIMEADLQLKTSGLPEEAILETLVCELAR